jgi:hypothetical protein
MKKRYVILGIIIVYAIFKVYVTWTIDPNDDQLPDKWRDIALKLAFANTDSR